MTHSNFEFELIYECEYSKLYYNYELMMAICSAEQEYIPINNFKTMFLKVSDLLETFHIKYLLFDRTFLFLEFFHFIDLRYFII